MWFDSQNTFIELLQLLYFQHRQQTNSITQNRNTCLNPQHSSSCLHKLQFSSHLALSQFQLSANLYELRYFPENCQGDIISFLVCLKSTSEATFNGHLRERS